MEQTRHEFEVVRLWEQPAEVFLAYPGLIPLAVLGQSADAEKTLRQATQQVDRITNPTTKANLMTAAGILAGLQLDEEVINRLVRRDIMQESVIYRSIQQEAEERTKASDKREFASKSLQEGLPVDVISRITGLSIEEVQQLQQQLNNSGSPWV